MGLIVFASGSLAHIRDGPPMGVNHLVRIPDNSWFEQGVPLKNTEGSVFYASQSSRPLRMAGDPAQCIAMPRLEARLASRPASPLDQKLAREGEQNEVQRIYQ